MNLHSNVIYNGNKAYKILKAVAMHQFLNKDDSVNRKVLGLYVNEIGGNHVLQHNSKFLICEEIEEAIIE